MTEFMKFANFDSVSSQIDSFVNGKKHTVLLCRLHGEVTPTPYYLSYLNGYIARDPVWTCLKCFEKHVGKPLVEAKEKAVTEASRYTPPPQCKQCGSRNQVEICTVCKTPVCCFHRFWSKCNDCAEVSNGG